MMAIGECLCGGVRYEVNIDCAGERLDQGSVGISDNNLEAASPKKFEYPSSPSQILVCNCSMCRRACGASNIPFAAFARDRINFVKKDSLKKFQSSESATRGFCGCCGAQVFFDSKDEYSIWMTLGLITNIDEVFTCTTVDESNTSSRSNDLLGCQDFGSLKGKTEPAMEELQLNNITYPACL